VIDFVSKRVLFLVFSAVVIVPGLISLVLPGGVKPGIDFTSGAIMTLRLPPSVEQGALRDAFADLGHPEAVVQRADDLFLVRTIPLREEVRDSVGQVIQPGERYTLELGLGERFGTAEILGFDSVSPLVAGETVQKSVLAVIAACGGILLYLWFAFRSVENSLHYGICAVAALVHDVLVLLGIFSLLGRFFHIELDALFITATLTVIGFSVHDTIVVFDRIRENQQQYGGEPFEAIVNHSLTQTLVRSVGTSLSTMLVLVALLLFGGVTIRPFVLALLIGVISGTYSSIFNASMLLVVWEKRDTERLIGRRPHTELGTVAVESTGPVSSRANPG
jgi:preprotein translocase subunit SecF